MDENKRGAHSYDAVILDMDGVIFDSERAAMECWTEASEKFGITDVREPYLATVGVTSARAREIMEETYGPDYPHDEIAKEASALYHGRYDGGRLPVKPGIFTLLDGLKRLGIKLAVASSTRRSTVERQLDEAGMLGCFDAVICGEDAAHGKPAPDIFLTAAAAVGADPERAYGIEDSYNGIRALHAAGMHSIMVPDLLPPTEEMEQLAEVILPDLTEAARYLGAE